MCVALAACGGGSGSGGDVHVDTVNVGDRADPATGDPAVAAGATTAFGAELFAAVSARAGGDADVVVSPASVAIALAMLEPGTVGPARTQLRRALGITDPAAFHASMNALVQDLENRKADEALNPGEKPGEITFRVADAAYLQRGYPFEPAYLQAIGRWYGPVLHEVDFSADPDAVAHRINRWVAEQTNDRIEDLVADGVLTDDTVLALVNALYLEASWMSVFDAEQTADARFTRRDRTRTTVAMMHGRSDASARGDGWVAATKAYVGGLAAQFVLPDEGRFDDVAGDMASVIRRFDERHSTGAALGVPRFDTRFATELTPALKALGLTELYQEGNLTGIAPDERLRLDKAIHQAFVAMDEKGTEAAAATVLTGVATSGPASPPVPVVLDRPFLFRIFDQRSGATLFLGRVLDPHGA